MNLLILPPILGLVALIVLCAAFGVRMAEPLLLWLANLPALGLVYVAVKLERQKVRRWQRRYEK